MRKKYSKVFLLLAIVLSVFSLLLIHISSNDSQVSSIDGRVSITSAKTLVTDNIHFMQSTAHNKTGDHTVLENAIALREGTLKPGELPKIRVWFDEAHNKIWTLDHRRLIAFKLAGLKNVPVAWATKDEIEKGSFKMTTPNGGDEINLLFSSDSDFISIERTKDYNVWSLEELKKIKDVHPS